MTTRCQILFIDKDSNKTQIYRHCDGYPKSVIYDLKKFKDFLNKHRSYSGNSSGEVYAGGLAAKFLFFKNIQYAIDAYELKKEVYKTKQTFLNFLKNPGEVFYHFTGHSIEEVSKGISGFEDYIYIVYVNNIYEKWKIKISKDFPNDCNNKKELKNAFENATWNYEDDLDKASKLKWENY